MRSTFVVIVIAIFLVACSAAGKRSGFAKPMAKVDVMREIAMTGNLRPVDFSGKNLSDLDLSQTNFRGANLTRATFLKANLTNALFDYATLEGTNFREARGYP